MCRPSSCTPAEFIRTLDDPGLADTILKYSSTYAVAHLDAFGYVKYCKSKTYVRAWAYEFASIKYDQFLVMRVSF